MRNERRHFGRRYAVCVVPLGSRSQIQKEREMNRYSTALLVALAASASANAGVWSFFDDELDSGDWSTDVVVIQESAAGSILHQPNGDPTDNGYLSFELEAEPGGALSAVAINNLGVYDPAVEGGVASIDVSVLARRLENEPAFVSGQLAIEQDGVLYRSFGFDASFEDDPSQWSERAWTFNSADSFEGYNPITGDILTDAHPDFSSSGGAMRFGFVLPHFGVGVESTQRIYDFDELSLQITSVPAPGAAALLGLAGLSASRRRR